MGVIIMYNSNLIAYHKSYLISRYELKPLFTVKFQWAIPSKYS